MSVLQMKVKEVVDSAVEHRWSIPEFQRGFVWRAAKVRDLAESLWRVYPVGSFLLWKSPVEVEARVVKDTKQPDSWVVDGQQRTTALTLLFGRKPYWWPASEDWNDALKRFDVRFNPFQKTEPFFQLASAVIRRNPDSDWIPVPDILQANDEKLSGMVDRLRQKYNLPSVKFPELWTALERVRKIREQDIVVVTVDHDLEDVVTIFTRLNSKGTKVTEADVFMALASSHNR